MAESPDLFAAEVATESAVASKRVQWNLQLSETPAILISEGSYRITERALIDIERKDDHSHDNEWTVMEATSAPLSDIANDLPVVLEQVLQNRQTLFRHELTGEFTQTGTPMPMRDRGTLAGIRHELSGGVRSGSSSREEWFWRVTLRLESNRPLESTIRPARMAVYGDILKAILAHWRTPA